MLVKQNGGEQFSFENEDDFSNELSEQINFWIERWKEAENKEQQMKLMFITSQQKWSNFSRNILIIAKHLMTIVDNSGINENINTIVYRSMKEKLLKYENVLRSIIEGQPGQNKNNGSMPNTSLNNRENSITSNNATPVRNDSLISPATQSRDQSPNIRRTDVKNQMSELRHSPSLLSQSVSYQQDIDNSVSRGPRTLPVMVSLAPLDYDKIKRYLFESADELKIWSTLQALRWRISKSRSYSQRAEVLHTYMYYDIFGIFEKDTDLLIHLLNKSRRVLAYTVFLINVMAGEPVGRNYLIKYDQILDTMFAVILNEKWETAIRQQAIVTIQKFSLRTKCQNKMIEMGMIKYIVYILKNELNTLSDYTLEYSTALLMNLSLRKNGKDKWEDPKLELLHVLNELLEHENDQVRTYVNGTLYSIFRRKSLRDQAKELGMVDVLNYLAQNWGSNEDYLKRQIQYIIGQLNLEDNENGDSSDEESDEEGDEEEEDIEGENDYEEELEGRSIHYTGFYEFIDEGDYDDTISGVVIGEEWLMSEFLAPTSDAMRQTTTIRSKIEEDKKQRGLDSTSRSLISNINRSQSRPITPSKTNSKIPFIEDQYMKSPMRTRNKIPRTPMGGQDDSRNDFQNDGQSQLELSIVLPSNKEQVAEKVNQMKYLLNRM